MPEHTQKSPPRDPISIMVKPAGPDCNLDCAYCFYRPKGRLFPDPHPRMDRELLRRFVAGYLDCHPGPVVPFAWQGGEPLLAGPDFFREAARLQQAHVRPGMTVHNAIQTNGTLIDREFARFFARNRWLVGVSLDGPADCHDVFRRRAGEPTHAAVMAGIGLLREHGADFNILCAVHAANQHRGAEVYRFLRDRAGAAFVQFIPIVGLGDGAPGPASVDPAAFGRFLADVWDVWRREDVGRVYVGHFDAALAACLGQPGGLCAMAGDCGQALVLEHDGGLYACDHFVDEAHCLGNLTRSDLPAMLDGPGAAGFRTCKSDTLPEACRRCVLLFACGGGCPKDRLAAAPGGARTPYLCPGVRRFFAHAGPELAAMAEVVRRQPSFRAATA